MARRGLSISEALKVLEELPSDYESECTESSDTEEYIPQQIEDTDVSDDDEEVDDPSQPGPSTQPQIPIWSLKKNLQKTLPDFFFWGVGGWGGVQSSRPPRIAPWVILNLLQR